MIRSSLTRQTTFRTEVKPSLCKFCRLRLGRVGEKLHPHCVDPWYQANRQKIAEKAAKAKAKVERETTRARKEAVKRLPDLHREAQKQFNLYTRLRDIRQPCISCGNPPPDLSGLHAGRDAGHFRSIGSAAHLRYTEDNCHAQCVRCNQWDAGNVAMYRVGLVARIGADRVEALEANNAVHKWTADEVRSIRDAFKVKARELQKRLEDA